jgi:hypothetical protein
MRRSAIFASLMVSAFVCSTANATPISAAASGLTGTDEVITFGANAYPNFTEITDQFAGITVQFDGFVPANAAYFTTGNFRNLQGGFLTTVISGVTSITFDHAITDLSFVYQQVGPGESTFTALLDGVLVETFGLAWNQEDLNNYFGFTGIVFDQLQVFSPGLLNMDTLAFNYAPDAPASVPEPNAVALFTIGLLSFAFAKRVRRSN